MNNSFVWVDLSTFDLQAAKHFYSQCLGWQYQKMGTDYWLREMQQYLVAGMFTMPKKLAEHTHAVFLDVLYSCSRRATNSSSSRITIEIRLQDAPNGGKIAFIRDPAGASFTCYEGNILSETNTINSLEHTIWNELHVSDLQKIRAFYTNLFGWRKQTTADCCRTTVGRFCCSACLQSTRCYFLHCRKAAKCTNH